MQSQSSVTIIQPETFRMTDKASPVLQASPKVGRCLPGSDSGTDAPASPICANPSKGGKRGIELLERSVFSPMQIPDQSPVDRASWPDRDRKGLLKRCVAGNMPS